jgi:hypothetical protein
MKHETVAQMAMRQQRDRAAGVAHGPLHTLQECCEAAGTTPQIFGRYAAQYPNAPKPVVQNGRKAHYRKPEVVQWVNKIRQQLANKRQQEKQMPDIRTALQQALSKTATAWAADDEAHQQTQPQQDKRMTTATTHADTIAATETETKTNVSRCVFEFIRDNPGYTVKQVVASLVARGFKENSVGSLVYQMLKVRLVVADANGKLTAVVQQYAPIQASSQRGRKVKVKVNAKAAAALSLIHI